MKVLILSCLLAYSALPATHADNLSPVTRVVELLKNLGKQIETEGQKEEDLYETYVCWAKSVIEQKTASNSAAASRISKLEAWIADLDAGRVELTSERADLEKEIEELMADMETAATMRKKEHDDFVEAEDEMKKAIAALDTAQEVLDEATKDHKKGVLMAIKTKLNGGIRQLQLQSSQLQYAVQLGQRFLTKADSMFLTRLLSGDVPHVDWKKLNRKATFKMAYKARSSKIQEVLAKMDRTFSSNLADARSKEADAQQSFDTLSQAKQEQLDAARSALTKMETETGAKGLSREQAVDEVDALKEQVTADDKFIKQTEAALAQKKEQWKARTELRTGEIEAISKAISILHNDDARDLFKKSFKSQGFMQVSDSLSTKSGRYASQAAAELRAAALKVGDQNLLALAKALTSPSVKGQFGPVIQAIDKMIALMQDQEKEDLERKQTCEKERMSDTRDAIVASRDIDEKTDKITRLVEEIGTLEEEVKALVAEHKQVQDELAQATKIREDEHAAFLITDRDDKAARDTVKMARDVIQNFYKENDLVFAQKQPAVAAGKAPPPPPPTWEGGYGGKKGESQGIVSILGMVQEDIEKDISTAKAEEDASEKEFSSFKSESEAKMESLMEQQEKKEGIKGEKEMEKVQTQEQRSTKKGELNAVLKKMDDIKPNCEYYEVNYVVRTKNRQIEIDGLQKAKAILQGGEFSEGPDPSREIKPGDAASAAFLQRRQI